MPASLTMVSFFVGMPLSLMLESLPLGILASISTIGAFVVGSGNLVYRIRNVFYPKWFSQKKKEYELDLKSQEKVRNKRIEKLKKLDIKLADDIKNINDNIPVKKVVYCPSHNMYKLQESNMSSLDSEIARIQQSKIAP